MIPKVIHYCWFSGDKKPKLMQRCIDSWQRVMPDYTIKCWDANSFDFDSVAFTKESLSLNKYASIADYIRLYALYTEGGIYLDADVFVYKDFAPLLHNKFFCGTEAYYVNNIPHYRMEAAIMAAEPKHPYVGECLAEYNQRHFIYPDGSIDRAVMPAVISEIAAQNFGYQYLDESQNLNMDTTVYPTSYFTNELITNPSTQLYAKHCNAGTWIEYKDRGKLFHFCRKHDLMDLYQFIEKIKHNK